MLLKMTESDVYNNMRFCLIQYTENNVNATAPFGSFANAYAQVFQSASTTKPINVPFDTQNTQNYRVLYDEVFTLNLNGNACAHKNILIKASDLKVQKLVFTDAVSNTTLPGLNEGLIIGWCCSDSVSGSHPSIDWSSKINFVDS